MTKKISKKPKFPQHLHSTPDEWRQKKRQEWKLVMNALQDFEWGAGYVPVTADLYQLSRLARRIAEDLEGDWIAW